MNVVIIEDDNLITLFLKNALIDLGHNIIGNFNEAKSFYNFLDQNKNHIDLVIMDILLKGSIDGIEAGIHLRKISDKISLLFVSSFNDSETFKIAKEAKPNAYLIKPISLKDLEASLMVIESLNENTEKNPNEEIINISNYTYDKTSKLIYENNKLIKLSKKEQLCINMLIEDKNKYISQEILINKIWENEEEYSLNSLRELVYRLRKKLPELSIDNSPIFGYILEV